MEDLNGSIFWSVLFYFVISDINECEEDKTLCSGEKQSCHNTDGSYECKCEDGLMYESESQKCIPKPKGKINVLLLYVMCTVFTLNSLHSNPLAQRPGQANFYREFS